MCLLKLNHHDLTSKIHTVKSYKVTQAEDENGHFASLPIRRMRSRFSALSCVCVCLTWLEPAMLSTTSPWSAVNFKKTADLDKV